MATDAVASPSVDSRVIAAPTGRRLALVQAEHVVVLEADHLTPIAELGIDGGPDNHDVAFAGDRLVVLARTGAGAILHVVDPDGPTKLGEIPFRVPTRILAVTGDLVLVSGAGITGIVDAVKVALAPLPIRTSISAAGHLGSDHFVIAAGGVLEEWDGARRSPGRRLRLDKPIDAELVGGSTDRIWIIPRAERDRLDVVGLDTRSTRRFELPEPAARIHAHARGDLLAIVGATTGTPFVVELSRRTAVVPIDHAAVHDLAWLGTTRTLVLLGRDGQLDTYMVPMPSELVDEPGALAAVPETPRPVTEEVPPARWSREDISQRLARWREKFQTTPRTTGATPAPSTASSEAAPAPAPAPLPPLGPSTPITARPRVGTGRHDRPHPGGWRAELATWARAITARSHRDPPTLDRGILDDVHARLELAGELLHALCLLYGAHLNGAGEVAPFELASVIQWNWPEALGSGTLAAAGVVRWRRDRARLVDVVVATLDERSPLTGDTITAAALTESAVAIVAPADIEPARIAAFAAPTVGALLVPNPHGEAWPRRFLLEAKLRGLTPLVPWTRLGSELRVPPARCAIVVEHETTAASLDLPVVATWTAPAIAG